MVLFLPILAVGSVAHRGQRGNRFAACECGPGDGGQSLHFNLCCPVSVASGSQLLLQCAETLCLHCGRVGIAGACSPDGASKTAEGFGIGRTASDDG